MMPRPVRSAAASHGAENPLVSRVAHAIAAHQLLRRADRVLVGVSGGADSVALLHILVRLQPSFNLTLYVVHVDHQLRPASAADAEFVGTLAERFHVPVIIERRDVAALCRKARWSLEDGARRIRYQCFLEAARRYTADAIALAHTADDQAETVLMRLVRGSGLTGLAGIPAARLTEGVRIVRPLLTVWRRDITRYLDGERLPHREDPSNEDVRFVRNRIRHELLPLLARDYNPNIKGALIQLAEQSRCDSTYLQASALRQWKRLARPSRSGSVTMTVRTLARQPKALQRQLVRHAIQRVQGDLNQFEFRHWLAVERLLEPSRSAHAPVASLPGGVRVLREGDRLIVQGKDEASPVSDRHAP